MVVAFTATAAVALMFSAVLLAFLLFIGTIAGLYLWWKMRGVRRHLQEMQVAGMESCAMQEGDAGIVIEGEAVRVDAKKDHP